MYCPECGTKVNDNDRFCTNCGHQLNKQTKPDVSDFVVEQNEEEYPSAKKLKKKKKKKSCLGRLFSTLIILFFMLFFAIGLSGNNDSATQKGSATVKPSATPGSASNATSTVTPTATPTISPTSTVKVSKASLVTMAKSVLEESASGFSYCKVDGDETGFTVYVAMDGLAFELAMYQELGKNVNEEGWQEVKDSLLYAYGNARNLLNGIGLDDASLMINMLNDNNHDYTLLSIFDGRIVYDVANE